MEPCRSVFPVHAVVQGLNTVIRAHNDNRASGPEDYGRVLGWGGTAGQVLHARAPSWTSNRDNLAAGLQRSAASMDRVWLYDFGVEELLHPRSDSVRRFLRRWYGTSDESSEPAFPKFGNIPPELIEWHKAAASVGVPVTFQDYPVKPEDLKRDADGMLVFWIENQQGFYWAVNPESADLQVFDRTNTSDYWRPTGENLERFLLHRTVHEALLGTETKFSAVAPTEVLESGVLNWFTVLPFSPAVNESLSTRWLCSSDALARVGSPPVGYAPPGQESWMFTVAAAPGTDLLKYRANLEPYILVRPRPTPFVEPPF